MHKQKRFINKRKKQENFRALITLLTRAIGYILLTLSVIFIVGFAGACDFEAYTGLPTVNISSSMIAIAITLALGIVLNIVSKELWK